LSFQKYFHYQPFHNEHKRHLRDILENRRLFFSDPHTVNDPWDCRPWFDCRPVLADPVKREDFLTFSRMFLPPDILNDPMRIKYEDLIRKDDRQLVKAFEATSRILGEKIALRRMYCLTPFPDSTLMWSHYADNHRGICLEFGKNNPLIVKARPVRYRDTYPEWTPLAVTDAPLDLVLTKSKDWAYEREFRIIGSLIDGVPTRLEGNFVRLPEGALTAIILGCENRDRDEIIEVLKAYAPEMALRRATRVPNHYN
jgi:hypothetical protein